MLGYKNLDGQTFYIVNKVYNQTRLAQWQTDGVNMGTFGGDYHADQLWELRANDNFPGYYYIVNCHHSLYRVTKWGKADTDVGAYKGDWYDDQLWKFTEQPDGFYYIQNKHYPDARMAKWGPKDNEWGTYAGPKDAKQQWKLVPRFDSKIGFSVVWEADNRQGSDPFSQKVTVTKGFKKSSSQTIRVEVGIKSSVKASAQAGLAGIGQVSTEIGLEFTSNLTSEFTETHEFSSEVKTEMTFTAPPGKIYRVLSLQGNFEDQLGDSFGYKGSTFKIEETD